MPARIVAAIELPVTVDFEGAYSVDPDEGAAQCRRGWPTTGAVGCNFEDQVIGGEGVHPLEAQAARIAAIRRAVGDDFFINARTDLFLKIKEHDDALVDAGDRARQRLRRCRRERLLRARAWPTRARSSGSSARCRCR